MSAIQNTERSERILRVIEGYKLAGLGPEDTLGSVLGALNLLIPGFSNVFRSFALGPKNEVTQIEFLCKLVPPHLMADPIVYRARSLDVHDAFLVIGGSGFCNLSSDGDTLIFSPVFRLLLQNLA